MTPLVDANLHVIAPPGERAAYPLAPGAGRAADEEATSIDELAAVMDRVGVGQGLLFSSRHHGLDNSYCVAAAARYPGRFAAIANIDVSRPSALDDLGYWTGERGMHGVRLWGDGAFHTDRRAAATWWRTPGSARCGKRCGRAGSRATPTRPFPKSSRPPAACLSASTGSG